LRHLRHGREKTLLATLLERSQQDLEKKKLIFNGYNFSCMPEFAGARSQIKAATSLQHSAVALPILVAGDKKAGNTCKHISEVGETQAIAELNLIEQTVGVPLVFIHVVRNPFDIAATRYIREHTPPEIREQWVQQHQFAAIESNQEQQQQRQHKIIQADAKLLQAIIDEFKMQWETVVQFIEPRYATHRLYNNDLLREPSDALRRLCVFLDIDVPAQWLEQCSKRVASRASLSRHRIAWPAAQRDDLTRYIEDEPLLARYRHFDSSTA